jgi:hypothetical protein
LLRPLKRPKHDSYLVFSVPNGAASDGSDEVTSSNSMIDF